MVDEITPDVQQADMAVEKDADKPVDVVSTADVVPELAAEPDASTVSATDAPSAPQGEPATQVGEPEPVHAKAHYIDPEGDVSGDEPSNAVPPCDTKPADETREGGVPGTSDRLWRAAERFGVAAAQFGSAAAETVTKGTKVVRDAVVEPDGPVQSAARKAGDAVNDTIADIPRMRRFSQIGVDLYASGAVTSHGGNLSESDGESIWITRTNLMLGHLGSGDVIRTTFEISETDEGCSRELVVHRAMYHAYKASLEEAGVMFLGAAIVHAHTTSTIFRSLVEDEIALLESESAYLIDNPVKVYAPQVSIASPEAAGMLASAVANGARIAVLRKHGPFAIAPTLAEALRLVSVLEQTARIANLRDATGCAFL
jgi:ribulose-5-phosphate 4-epimerase/fuculose-1-phosphate aldolase